MLFPGLAERFDPLQLINERIAFIRQVGLGDLRAHSRRDLRGS